MKKSPIKTTDKSRSTSRTKLTTTQVNTHVHVSLYYCHYKNAMYMGGIKSFKKDGRGILLHDDGISAITSYSNDQLHGHNIFFDNYGLLSAMFNKNKFVEVVYRTEGFLVYLTYNNEGQLQGKTLLLNYITKSIIHATFKKGNMVDKSQENDFGIINKVFDLGQLEFLIGNTHSRVIKYDFQKIHQIQTQKQGNRIVVGFEKNGFINGLGFNFIFRGSHGGYNPDTHRNQDEFQLRLVERGYYINTQLNGMGEKMFKNGNLYVGQFKNNVFEGHGILKNSEKRNWVSGYFENGNLVQLIEYNSEGEDKKFHKIIEALHERKTNWINNEVQLINFNVFVDEIQKIIKVVPNRHIKTLEQRKQEVLKKIQQKFISQNNVSFDNQISQESLSQLKNNNGLSSSSNKKYIHNFTPEESKRKIQSIQSENEEGVSFKAYSPPKPQKESPVRVKLFDRSGNKDIRNKKQSQSRESQSKFQLSRPQINPKLVSSGVNNKRYLNQPSEQRYEFGTSSRSLRKANTSSNLDLPLSSDRQSAMNKERLDSKRMIGKNKIFKYLQKQEESSPKFTYTRIDP